MANVFMENLKGIVETSYAGEEKPKYDWQTSIDMFINENRITVGMNPAEIEAQRTEFLEYVAARQFDKEGNDITKPAPGIGEIPQGDMYLVNGKYIKITGDMIKD